MSSSGDGDKPAQSGLVDMGDIGFYNSNNPDVLITFTIADLANYPGSFSEIVLNVTWAQLQSAADGPLETAFIDNAISAINAYNAANGTNVGIKLRVWGGYVAPDWAKNIDGPPITITGQHTVDQNFTPQTIGRFWTADYIAAWTSLQNQLAATYDNNPVIRGISQTAGASATDEPFIPLKGDALLAPPPSTATVNQVAELQAGGYNDAARLHDEPLSCAINRVSHLNEQLPTLARDRDDAAATRHTCRHFRRHSLPILRSIGAGVRRRRESAGAKPRRDRRRRAKSRPEAAR